MMRMRMNDEDECNLKPEPVSETDPDNEIFKNRAHEKSIPLSQCNDITEKLKKLDI